MSRGISNNWLSKEGKEATVAVIAQTVFKSIIVKFPFLGIPVVSNFINWLLHLSFKKGMETGFLIINDALTDSEVNSDMSKFIKVYSEVRNARTKDMSMEEIRALNEKQIEAARRFLRVGRARL